MTKAEKPKTVLETILAWSRNDRPEWQRDALRRIVVDGTPGKDDIKELLDLCKKEHGDQSVTATAEPLEEKHLPVDPGEGESIGLASMEDIIGVNQLASDQKLEFQTDGLTIIYGANGSGKSGYARVLKKACRARHAGEIMPDIYHPSPTGNAKAKLSVSKSDGSLSPIDWEDNTDSSPELSAITVFDRDCASVHLQKKNEVWFRPFGLDIPDDLAGVSQQLKDKLTAEREQLEKQKDPAFDNPTWSPLSTIGKALSSLKSSSDLSALEPEEEFSEAEEARLLELQSDLGRDPAKAAASQNAVATSLEQMLSALREIEKACGDQALKAIIDLRTQADTARQVADAAANTAFGDLDIEGVGTPIWKGLWESARRYSESIGEEGIGFPPAEGDICVLCHQPISGEAAARMGRFEAFIKADTEAIAERAKAALDAATKDLVQFRIDIRLVSAARKALAGRDYDAARQILKFMARARLRRWQTLKQALEGQQQELAASTNLPGAQIEQAVSEIRTYAASLAATADPQARTRLETELAELQDRKQADNLISIGTVEIERLKKIAIIDACLGEMATTAITRLGNQIADDLITPTMRDQFYQEIVDLAANRVRVEVVRSGGKFGSPQYEVRFLSKPKAKVGDVLSEGEQTCVALASYLTELANASHTSALVFDDPVTSLDHRWRNKVAQRLVAEAAKRQVIVFTHDLIFVNDLHEMGLDSGVPIRLAHLTRGTDGVGVVKDDLPWRASKVPDRIDKLEKAARAAKKLHEAGDEEAYRREALNIYDELRAAWERGLEDIVFAGVILRHRDYIKTANLKKVTVLDEADASAFQAGFGKCSDYIKAHDPSRGRDADPPEPDELLADIEALKTWAETLRTKQKAVA